MTEFPEISLTRLDEPFCGGIIIAGGAEKKIRKLILTVINFQINNNQLKHFSALRIITFESIKKVIFLIYNGAVIIIWWFHFGELCCASKIFNKGRRQLRWMWSELTYYGLCLNSTCLCRARL